MNTLPEVSPAVILLAEDKETDAIFFRIALQQSGLPHILITFQDGQQTIAYLRGDFPYTDRSDFPLPRLLVLDLDMPRVNGFDVLSWLASQSDLKHLPAVILSSSSRDSDIAKARQLGAVDYHVKTHHFADLVEIIQSLDTRWLSQLPSHRHVEKASA